MPPVDTFYLTAGYSFLSRTVDLTWHGSWNTAPTSAQPHWNAGSDHFGSALALLSYKTGGTLQQSHGSSATDPYAVAFMRFLSEPLQGEIGYSATLDALIRVQAGTTFQTRIYAYLTVGNTDAVRAVLLDHEDGSAWSGTAQFRNLDSPPTTNTVTWNDGDRLCIELGAVAHDAGSAHTGTMWARSCDSGVPPTEEPDATDGQTSVHGAGFLTLSVPITVMEVEPLVRGDLVVGNGDIVAYDGVTLEVKGIRYVPGGLGTAIGAQDAEGNIVATNENMNAVLVLDRTLQLLAQYDVGSPRTLPHFVAFDRDGTFYVGHTGNTFNGPCVNDSGPSPSTGGTAGIGHYAADGSFIDVIDADVEEGGTSSGDLSRDRSTLYYGSVGRQIKRVRTFDGGQLADLITFGDSGTVRGMKVLPNGDLLVADEATIKRVSASGSLLQTITVVDQADWGTIALGPTGEDYFWSANTGTNEGAGIPVIMKFTFDGTPVASIETPISVDITGSLLSQLCSGGVLVIDGFRAAVASGLEDGIIGPLVWIEWPRRLP